MPHGSYGPGLHLMRCSDCRGEIADGCMNDILLGAYFEWYD